MESSSVFTFLFASMALTIMPGPDNIYVLTESLTKGFKTGFTISIGLCLGVFIHTIATATGISIIIQKSELLFNSFQYLGAGYLLYLALQAFQETRLNVKEKFTDTSSRKTTFQNLKKGFFMNLLNPKVSLFFIVFLPSFISPNGLLPLYQMLILGFLFVLQALLIFGIIAKLSSSFSHLFTKEKFWEISKFVKIIILISLAVYLII
ncbi:LysE family translocator [Bacteroidota bacterium]